MTWNIAEGQSLSPGDLLGEAEADKAVFSIRSAVGGMVESILVPVGESVRMGTPLVRLRTRSVLHRKVITREDPGQPVLTARVQRDAPTSRHEERGLVAIGTIGLSVPVAVEGSLRVTNEELVRRFEGRTADDILRRTGIKSRARLGPHETVLQLGAEAARRALDQEGLTLGNIDALICHTTTPPRVTPSLACLIANELAAGRDLPGMPAWDINAACSGYLYALRVGFDYLQGRPEGRVLVVTAEGLSELVDPADFDTAILFGDAATATVLYGTACGMSAPLRLHRPSLSGKGEDGSALGVPLKGAGTIQMDGKKVFRAAVHAMTGVLRRACAEAGVAVDDLDLVIPHQANGRIIEAVRHQIGFPTGRVVNVVIHHGNTSSSSIPLAISDLPRPWSAGRWGLCAFGGGFTSAGAVVEVIR